jgi:hypothetical protein
VAIFSLIDFQFLIGLYTFFYAREEKTLKGEKTSEREKRIIIKLERQYDMKKKLNRKSEPCFFPCSFGIRDHINRLFGERKNGKILWQLPGHGLGKNLHG